MTNELLAAVRAALPASRAAVIELARRSGVPPDTVLKIRSGETANPRVDTVERLLVGAGWRVQLTPACEQSADEVVAGAMGGACDVAVEAEVSS